MFNSQNLYVILFSLPVYQLIFYTVQLITFRRKSNQAIFPLGLLVAFMTLYLLANTIYFLGFDQNFSHIYPFYIPLLLMILPTLYLYFQSVSGNFTDLEIRRLVVLYLPSIFILALNYFSISQIDHNQLFIFLSSGFRFPVENALENHLAEQVFWLGNVGFLGAQLVLIFIKTYRITQRVRAKQDENASFVPYFKADWTWLMMGGIILFVLSAMLMNIFTPRGIVWAVVYNASMLISGGLVGYVGLRQFNLYREVEKIPVQGINVNGRSSAFAINPDSSENNPDPEKNGNNTHTDRGGFKIPAGINMNEEELRNSIKELRRVLASEKLYLDPGLSISDLAHKIKLSRRTLSIIINDLMKTNYYGLVNDYRILEAKEVLKRNEYNRLTIEAIANMCGFQSKSSFNACFKKATGQTPSEYKNSFKNKKAGN